MSLRTLQARFGPWRRRLLVAGAPALLLSLQAPSAGTNLAAAPVVSPAAVAAALLAQGDEPTAIDWQILAGLDYKTGELSETLKKLNGKPVKVPGFMVPLEDFATSVSEFLLVPWFGACVHTPPPPPNQTVYVKMAGGKETKVGWWDPVWVEGTLRIEKVESVYGVAGFQLEATKITPYEM